jgi:hypothetical protein
LDWEFVKAGPATGTEGLDGSTSFTSIPAPAGPAPGRKTWTVTLAAEAALLIARRSAPINAPDLKTRWIACMTVSPMVGLPVMRRIVS